jgi:hypothetical protein
MKPAQGDALYHRRSKRPSRARLRTGSSHSSAVLPTYTDREEDRCDGLL